MMAVWYWMLQVEYGVSNTSNKSTNEVLTVRKEYGGEARPRCIEAAGVVHLSMPYNAEKHPIVNPQISYSEGRSRREYIGE